MKQHLYPHIGNIAIGIGAVGILAHVLAVLTKKYLIFGPFVIASFENYPALFMGRGGAFTQGVNLITVLFLLLMIFGGLIYKRTEKKDSRLLRFTFAIVFVSGVIRIINTPLFYWNWKLGTKYVTNSGDTELNFLTFSWRIIYILPIAILAYLFVKWLQADQPLAIQSGTNARGETQLKYDEVSKWTRFVHLLFDSIIMLFVFGSFIWSIISVISGRGFAFSAQPDDHRWVLQLTIAMASFLSYLVFEGFFHASPTKFLTGTRVVNSETLAPPSFGQILGRTFSRLIPFEAFSFFGKRGWHDSLPETTVVKEDNFGQSRRYHRYWWLLLVLALVGPWAYSSISGFIEEGRSREFRDAAYIAERQSQTRYIGEGLVIIGRNRNDYRDDRKILRIISIEDSTLQVERYRNARIRRPDLIKFFASPTTGPVDTATVSFSELVKAVPIRGQVNVIADDTAQVIIEDLHNLAAPEFRRGGIRRSTRPGEEAFSVTYSYDVTPVEVVAFKNIQGELQLEGSLPIRARFDANSGNGSFTLNMTMPSSRKHYISELTLRFNGESLVYVMELQGNDMSLYRK